MTRVLFVSFFLSVLVAGVCAAENFETRYGDTPVWEVGAAVNTSQGMPGNRRVCEKMIQAEVLWAMLNPAKKLSPDFEAAWSKADTTEKDADTLLNKVVEDSPLLKKGRANDMLLVNTTSRDRWGICFIGKIPKTDKSLAMYKNNIGNVLPIQAVPDPTGETCSLYADFSFGEKPGPVSALGMMSLSLDAAAEIPVVPSSLDIDAETGEMGNDLFRLVIDKRTGAVKSLQLANTDHEFVDTENGEQGLNASRIHSGHPVTLTVVASGPLVASMFIETAGLKRQITIFTDSERIRIENVFDNTMIPKLKRPRFSFSFNIPDGKWFFDSPNAQALLHEFLPYRYAVYAGEKTGVNWITVDSNRVIRLDDTLYCTAVDDQQSYSEYWIWPYAASFNNSIAQRFARQVHQPLVRIDGMTTANSPAKWLQLENDENIVVSSVKPARDGSGALFVRLFNPTPYPLSTAFRLPPPYQKIYRSTPQEDRLEELREVPLAPWEIVQVRME